MCSDCGYIHKTYSYSFRQAFSSYNLRGKNSHDLMLLENWSCQYTFLEAPSGQTVFLGVPHSWIQQDKGKID